jgi:hypothetical protein
MLPPVPSPECVPGLVTEGHGSGETSHGPTKTLADSLDAERRDEFHRTWVDFFDREYTSNGKVEHTRESLLVLGTRR